MIISASRRTDIPAFFAKWFINRVREGFCYVQNPMNSKQIAIIDLSLENVDLFVFWTKNPQPFFPYLQELTERGYKYYFQFTVNNYPKEFEPNLPPFEKIVPTFQDLSELVGKEKVVWRYDPILISNLTDLNFHCENFTQILEQLSPFTDHIVTSLYDNYRGSSYRFKKLKEQGIFLTTPAKAHTDSIKILKYLVKEANLYNLDVYSCAEEETILHSTGILKGKCIDPDYINKVFNINVTSQNDPGQRELCGCVLSRDIGAYDSCLHGCTYCYASKSFRLAQEAYQKYDFKAKGLLMKS